MEQEFADGSGSGVPVGNLEGVQAYADRGRVQGLTGAAAGEEQSTVRVGRRRQIRSVGDMPEERLVERATIEVGSRPCCAPGGDAVDIEFSR